MDSLGKNAVKLQHANKYKLRVGFTGLASQICNHTLLLIERQGLVPCKDGNYKYQPLIEIDTIGDVREGVPSVNNTVISHFSTCWGKLI